jgi:hypothetical protein
MSIAYKHGMGLHAIVIGGPIDGFRLVGPFNHAPEALEWANFSLLSPHSWWITPLEDPAEQEVEWGEED